MLIAFNKPYGVLSQFTPDGSPNRTLAEFSFPPRVYPIGRLDADSEGLLLLSDEPELNERLLHPRRGHKRVYWAQVESLGHGLCQRWLTESQKSMVLEFSLESAKPPQPWVADRTRTLSNLCTAVTRACATTLSGVEVGAIQHYGGVRVSSCTCGLPEMQILHRGSLCLAARRRQTRRKALKTTQGQQLLLSVTHVVLKVRLSSSMKIHLHDVVRRVLELHGLEERLEALRRDPDERTNAEALIESLRANLPMGVLMVHDQMRARGKRSVAEVRHGVCTGCHLALGVGNVAALRAGEMRRCGNCGRYVYVVEEEVDTASPAKAKRKLPTRSAGLVPNPAN